MPILSSSNHTVVCRFLAATGNDLCCSFKLICGGTHRLLLISSLWCMISICDPTLQPAQDDSCPLEIAHFIIYCLRLCSISIPPTLSISCYLMNTLPPPTLWLAGQIQQNYPCELEFLQYSCQSVRSLSPQAGARSHRFYLPDPPAADSLFWTLLLAGLLFVAACLGALSDEDPSVVPGGAAGMSLHPWTQRLSGAMYDLWTAPAATAAGTNLQHHGEHMCVSL